VAALLQENSAEFCASGSVPNDDKRMGEQLDLRKFAGEVRKDREKTREKPGIIPAKPSILYHVARPQESHQQEYTATWGWEKNALRQVQQETVGGQHGFSDTLGPKWGIRRGLAVVKPPKIHTEDEFGGAVCACARAEVKRHDRRDGRRRAPEYFDSGQGPCSRAKLHGWNCVKCVCTPTKT